MRIKVCGITRSVDAECATSLGAWAVGFVFVRTSPRYVSCEEARRIVERLPKTVEKVGVFENASSLAVLGTCRAAGLTIAQLHGDESPETVADVASRMPVIKAIRLKEPKDLERLRDYSAASAFIVDGPRSGSGLRSDWELAREAKRWGTVLLAGGLTPENAREACELVRPHGLDVSSGLESAPGIKDAGKLRRFFEVLP